MTDRPPHGSGFAWFILAAPVFWAIVAVIVWASSASPATYIISKNDRGGLVEEYRQRVFDHNSAGDRVELRMRRCLSACTMYLAVTNMCVDRDTKFGFHGARIHGKRTATSDKWDVTIAAVLRFRCDALGDWFMVKAAGERQVTYLTGAQLILDCAVDSCPS